MHTDACDLRNFYAGIKELFGAVRTSTGSLLAADNANILTDPQDILLHWKEHFSTLLNRKSSTNESFLRNISHPPQLWMNIRTIFQEFKQNMKQMR